ncbi:MAG TPA: Lrp/AsnC family transcriptional regulator, partial [Devosia sp.]|nr:Lrp/AsnC family transcriptional regulator [Devosia sp.]
MSRLGEIDRKLLLAVQADCQQSVQRLGEKVGLSPSACHRRLKALEEKGFILAYRATLSADKLGFSMQFFISVSLGSQSEKSFEEFEAAVKDVPEILECHLMAGQSDY